MCRYTEKDLFESGCRSTDREKTNGAYYSLEAPQDSSLTDYVWDLCDKCPRITRDQHTQVLTHWNASEWNNEIEMHEGQKSDCHSKKNIRLHKNKKIYEIEGWFVL